VTSQSHSSLWLIATTALLACLLTGLALPSVAAERRTFTVDLPKDPLVPTEASCNLLRQEYSQLMKSLGSQFNACQDRNPRSANANSPRCEQSRYSGLIFFSCEARQPCVGLKDAVTYVLDSSLEAKDRCDAAARDALEFVKEAQALLNPDPPPSDDARTADRKWLADVSHATRDIGDKMPSGVPAAFFAGAMADLAATPDQVVQHLESAFAAVRRPTATHLDYARLSQAVAAAGRQPQTAVIADQMMRELLANQAAAPTAPATPGGTLTAAAPATGLQLIAKLLQDYVADWQQRRGPGTGVMSSPGAALPVRVGDKIQPPRKVHHVSPVYPPIAQSTGVQGIVIAEATIAPTGAVQDVRILRSIPLLDQAAREAVSQWRFSPTVLNGVAVPVIMTVTVQFTLQSKGAAASPTTSASAPREAEPVPSNSGGVAEFVGSWSCRTGPSGMDGFTVRPNGTVTFLATPIEGKASAQGGTLRFEQRDEDTTFYTRRVFEFTKVGTGRLRGRRTEYPGTLAGRETPVVDQYECQLR
jgi:TonB family protein